MDFIEIEVYKIIEMCGNWGRTKMELKTELNRQMRAMELLNYRCLRSIRRQDAG